MATAVNGELLALSGPRNPYPGSWASSRKDALPICSSSMAIRSKTLCFAEPATRLMVIMKDGKLYKNTLPA